MNHKLIIILTCLFFIFVQLYAKEPVAYWKFNETSGTTAADAAGKSNGTLVDGSNKLWVKGYDGNAIDFTKATVGTAHVRVPDNDIIEFGSKDSFTISMLINANPIADPSEQQIINKGAFSVDPGKGWEGKWYGMQFKGGEVRIAVDDNENKTQLGVNITDIWPANKWAHLVGIRDLKASTLKLYLNGALIGEMPDITKGDITSGKTPLLIGLNFADERQLKGQLDDLKIFDYALSEKEIQDMFKGYGISRGSNEKMLVYYKFDEKAGKIAADAKGKTKAMVSGGKDAMWVPGLVGNAIDFTKSGDLPAHVEIRDNGVLRFGIEDSFSISMLVKVDPLGNLNEQQIIDKGGFSFDRSKGWDGKWYGMQFKGGEVRIAVDDNENKTQLGVKIADIWPVNKWAHLVGIRDVDSGTLKLYLNGKLIGEMENVTKGKFSSPGAPILIGINFANERPLDGQLDELKFFKYALSEDEIKEMHKAYGIK